MICLADETVARFAEGDLDAAGWHRVQSHLDRCPDCRRLVAGLVRRTQTGSTGPSLPVGGLLSWAGRRLGRYTIRDRIGRGAMGVVYRGYDPQLARDVAIKVVATSEQTAAAQDRLLDEARALAQLSHPNVVRVYDAGLSGGVVYLVMEYVDGTSLADWLHAKPRSRAAILEMFDEAARGLAAMHERGLVHRDFKPDNVLVASDRRVLVSDFGLVQWLPSTDLTDPGSGSGESTDGDDAMPALAGTPAYMAPEQLRGDPVGPAGDQFSFCVALFEALCGQRPFAGRTITARYREIVHGAIAPCLAAQSRSIRRLLRRGLGPVPSDRFASMEALRRALHPGAGHGAIAGLAGVGVAVGIGLWYPGPTDDDPCTWIERGAVWTPDDRAEAQEAFAAIELPIAAATWPRIDDELTAFEQAWRSDALRLCHSGADEHARCLEAQRGQAQATVAVLKGADDAVVDRAPALLEDLPDASRCETGSRGPEGPAAYPDLQRRLALSQALRNGGDPTAAEGEARAVLALVRRDAVDALESRASLQVGLALSHQDLLDEAQVHTERAHWSAITADDPRIAAWAAIELVSISAHRQDTERADYWLRQAEVALHRLERRDEELESHLAHVRATSSWRRGDDWAAVEHTERALDLARQSGREQPGRTAALHTDIATFLVGLGELDDAELRYRIALEALEEASGPEHANTILTLIGLGACQRQAGKLDASAQTLRLAARRAEAGYGSDSSLAARAAVNLASTLSALGDLGGAQAALQRGLEIWRRRHGPDFGEHRYVYEGLAEVARFRGDRDAAFAWLYQAASLCERVYGGEHACNGEVAYELSGTASLFDEHDEALRHARRASTVWSQALGPDHIHVAFALRNEGDALARLDRPDEAIVAYQRALAVYDAAGAPGSQAGTMLSGLAEALLAVGRVDEAEARAREALDTELVPIHRGSVGFVLARVLLARGARGEATQVAREARRAMIDLGPHMKPYIDDIEGWMAEHRIATESKVTVTSAAGPS